MPNFYNMDYVNLKCKSKEEDQMFVAIGQYVSFEVIENGYSSQILIDRNDLEKLLPLLLKYYYKLHEYDWMD
jgi:hypothetical protein